MRVRACRGPFTPGSGEMTWGLAVFAVFFGRTGALCTGRGGGRWLSLGEHAGMTCLWSVRQEAG